MARQLKTYVTSIGFFEEAIAAPSMKAALEAWGSDRNLFQQGFAKETSDPAIITATMKEPGIVLRRPVGSTGPFTIRAELPKSFIDKQPAVVIVKNKIKPAKNSTKANKKTVGRDRKAAQAYKRQEKRREKQRQKAEAVREKLKQKREAVKAKATLALKKAETEHERRIQVLKQQQTTIDEKIEAEEMNWNDEKGRLEAAIDKLNE